MISTWKLRPSGEKTEFERSYPVPIDVCKYNELGHAYNMKLHSLTDHSCEDARRLCGAV